MPVRIVDAAAILFIVLLIVLEVNHYIDGSAPYGGGSELAQVGLDVSLLLAVVIGLERIGEEWQHLHLIGARLLALALLFTIVFGLGAEFDPWQTGEPVGGPIINLVLLGYGIPALLAGVLAL